LTISGEPWRLISGILKLTGKRWRIFRAGAVGTFFKKGINKTMGAIMLLYLNQAGALS